jgi:hypothetical protein
MNVMMAGENESRQTDDCKSRKEAGGLRPVSGDVLNLRSWLDFIQTK